MDAPAFTPPISLAPITLDTSPADAAVSESMDGFLYHMLRFDNPTKSELLNLLQYVSLAIVPIVGLNKAVQTYIPPADATKPSLELLLEVLLQAGVMFVGLFFVHRFCSYWPPYSGTPYASTGGFVPWPTILLGLMIILSLQTKIGEKTNALVARARDTWDGRREGMKSAQRDNEKEGEEDEEDEKEKQEDGPTRRKKLTNIPLPEYVSPISSSGSTGQEAMTSSVPHTLYD